MKADTHLAFKSFSVPYYYSVLFGWMPIRIPKDDNDEKNKNTWYVPGIMFSICYILLLVVSADNTHNLRDAIKYQGNRTSSNLTTHDRVQIIVGPMFITSLWLNQMLIVVTYVSMLFHLKGLREVFELFNGFFKRHGSIVGDKVSMDKLARNANIESVALVVLNTVLSITSVITSFGRIRLSFALKMFVMADNVIKKMESLSLCVQFWCVCSVLTKCLGSLNATLDGLRIRKTLVTVTKPPDLFIVPDPSAALPAVVVTHLRRTNRAHADLCTILDRVNDVYQVLILLNVITCVLSMLPHLFVLGIIMVYSNFRITPPVSMVIWPLQYMMRVFVVCRAASVVSDEAARTRTVLKAAFHKRLTDDEKNEDYIADVHAIPISGTKVALFRLKNRNRIIKRFLERIDNKKIRFSLCGLSYLDDEYFLSSLMAVGGYLVIIIQSYMTVIEEQYPIHARPSADKFDE